jgi:hypothetical protein
MEINATPIEERISTGRLLRTARFLRSVSLGLAMFSLGMHVGSTYHEELSEPMFHATEETEPSTTDDLATSQYATPEELRGAALPSNLDNLLGDELVRVYGLGNCTGMIVNGYLLTATHCVWDKQAGEIKDSIQTANAETHYNEANGKASAWLMDTNDDLLLARLSSVSATEHGWHVPVFAEGVPARGTRFAIASLPGDVKSPVAGHLTLIAVAKDANTGRSQLVLTVDSDNDKSVKNRLCQPGASGSFVTDGAGSVGVLNGVTTKFNPDGEINEGWTGAKQQLEDAYKVDLSETTMICFATAVDRTKISSLVARLDGK